MNKALRTGGVGSLGIVFLLYLTHSLPFKIPQTVWSSVEEYTQSRGPAWKQMIVEKSARTPTGVWVGNTQSPGRLEWYFVDPGPRPNVIIPTWEPHADFFAQISLFFPGSNQTRPKILSVNQLMRDRPIDIHDATWGSSAFAIRFEGQNAALVRLGLYQTLDPAPPAWPFVLAILALIFLLPGSGDSRVILLIVGIAFLMRWNEFVNYFSIPLSKEALPQPWHEPAYALACKLATSLFGESDASIRFAGLLIACGNCSLICRLLTVFRRPHAVGWVAGLLYALNPVSLFLCVQGFAFELATFLFLALLWAWQENRIPILALIASALLLTRIQFLFPIGVLCVMGYLRFKWKRKQVLQFGVPFLVFLLPYLWGLLTQVKGSFVCAQSTEAYLGTFFINANALPRWGWIFGVLCCVGIGACWRQNPGRWLFIGGLLYASGLPLFPNFFEAQRVLFQFSPGLGMMAAIGLSAVLQFRPIKFFQAKKAIKVFES